jgi:hypothetical protein
MSSDESDTNAKILSLSMQARQHGAAAIEQLVDIVQNTNSHAARLAAINTLLDRGFGRSPQSLDIATRQTVEPEPMLSEEEAAAYYAAIRKQPHDDH